MNNKAVVLGANYYIGLSTIRCLGKKGVYVVAVDYEETTAYGFKSKYCKEKLIGPHYKKEPQNFLGFLIEYAKKQEAKPVLIPTADPYVEFIDQFFYELKEYFLFPQTEKNLATHLMNKEDLYDIAEAHGVKYPETVKVEQEDYVDQVTQKVGYPCMVKPKDSPAFMAVFRRKTLLAKDETELQEAVQKAHDAGLEVIIQQIIPGFDDHMYTFDAYMNQKAEVTHWTTAQKFRQYPINFGASVYTTQKYVPELYDIGAKFFKAIGYKGFAEIEFKKHQETGEFYLIEINVRITNFNTMLEKVGLNMPYLTYLDMVGVDIGEKVVDKDTGVTFWYAYEDFFAVRDYIRTKQLKPGQVLQSMFRKKAPAIWEKDDIKPFIHYNNLLANKLIKKIFKKQK